MDPKPLKQEGQILVIALIVVGLVLANTLAIVGGSQIFYQNTNYSVQSNQAINLAEAGIDKAVASLNATGGSYSGESETSLGPGSYSVSITTPNSGTKVIESTGYFPSKTDPKTKKTIKITVSKGVGVSFNYGVQVGDGGLEMSNDSKVLGSVYSNGNIVMSNNASITGDVYVAGGTAPTADQSSECVSPNCSDFVFGTNVSGNSRLDIGQSFKPSTSQYLNKVALRLKKFGSPSDITVRIMKDASGKPDKNNVVTSGTLPANLVTNQYGYVEVTFSSTPALTAGNIYWIVLDTSSSSTNYWAWSVDQLQGYNNGQAKWSSDWQDHTPVWNATTVDLDFKTYMGGVTTYIQGSNGALVGGDAHANTIQSVRVNGGAYYQTIQGSTAGSLHPNSEDPPAKVMPVSDANITDWKDGAADAGVYSGNISSCRTQLGPGKYIGNVSFSNGCTVTIKDPVWITGNLSLSNNVILKLDPSYNTSSGVIVVDGTISLANNVKIQGSGTAGSFLMTLTTYDSRSNDLVAVDVSNTGNQGILYAPFGIASISNNNHLSELAAWKVSLGNGVEIEYDNGFASSFFSSGPSGSYSVVKGTYQIK